MADSYRRADALLTEHFRYTPLILIDDIINAVNTILYHGIEAIENGLLNIPPQTLGFKKVKRSANPPSSESNGSENEYQNAQDEIENGVHQLETLLEATMDKAFDKLELYTLGNILTVPEDLVGYIRLSHYENIQTSFDAASCPSPESIHLLRRQLVESRKLNAALRETETRNAALLDDLRSLLSSPSSANSTSASHPSSISFLSSSVSSPQGSNHQPLTEKAQFAMSQLLALRRLVEDLRPRLQALKKAVAKNDGTGVLATDAKEAERKAYVENTILRAVKGAERNGMVPDSSGVGSGERRGEEEVGELEAVVRGLGGAGEKV